MVMQISNTASNTCLAFAAAVSFFSSLSKKFNWVDSREKDFKLFGRTHEYESKGKNGAPATCYYSPGELIGCCVLQYYTAVL